MSGDEELLSSEIADRLCYFIRSEKPNFEKKFVRSHLSQMWAVRPKQTNRRIVAQQAAFILFGLKTELISTSQSRWSINRLRVTSGSKGKIIDELDGININGSTLFPEIESAAKYIMSKVPLDVDHESD